MILEYNNGKLLRENDVGTQRLQARTAALITLSSNLSQRKWKKCSYKNYTARHWISQIWSKGDKQRCWKSLILCEEWCPTLLTDIPSICCFKLIPSFVLEITKKCKGNLSIQSNIDSMRTKLPSLQIKKKEFMLQNYHWKLLLFKHLSSSAGDIRNLPLLHGKEKLQWLSNWWVTIYG